MKLRYEAKIVMGKEEGGTSHICQAYDYKVAKMEKSSSVEAISALKNISFLYQGVVDQYSLVHAFLYEIRETTEEKWIRSLTKVNLKPSVAVEFQAWCLKIKEILKTGSVFDIDASQNPYDLFPTWWRGMSVDQKKTAVEIVVASGGFTGDCLIELQEQLFISMSDMQQFRSCCECAIEDPTHLDI